MDFVAKKLKNTSFLMKISYSTKLTRHKTNSHEIKAKEINVNAYGNL